MATMRAAIAGHAFGAFRGRFLDRYAVPVTAEDATAE
jgi:hypothetical protein